MFRPVKLEVSGFRGVNENFSIDLDRPVILFFGPNGSGKTSILSAYEWCLFGDLTYLSGEEFTFEDAIANLHSEKGEVRVKLFLTDGTRNIVIERFRRRGIRTKAPSRVIVKVDDKVLRDYEAQEFIVKELGVNRSDFECRVMLHQEALSRFIYAKPTERGKIFSRLLGLGFLVDVGSAIDDALPNIKRRLDSIQMEIEMIVRDKFGKLEDLRKSKDELVKELLMADINLADISLLGLINLIKSLRNEIYFVGDEIGFEVPVLELPEANLTSLKEALTKLDELYLMISNAIDEYLTTSHIAGEIAELMKIKNEIENLTNSITRIKEEIKEFTDKFGSIENLQSKIRECNDEIKKLKERLAELSSLEPLVRDLDKLSYRLEDIRSRVSSIMSTYGTITDIESKVNGIKKSLGEVRNEIKVQNLLSRILQDTLEFLESEHVDKCPVCEASINVDEVKLRLSERLSSIKDVDLIRKLRKREKDLIRSLTEWGDQLDKLKKLLKEEEKLVGEIERLKFKIGNLTTASLIDEKTELQSDIENLKVKLASLRRDEENFQKLIITLNSSRELLDKWIDKVGVKYGVSLSIDEVLDFINSKIDALRSEASRIDEKRKELRRNMTDISNRIGLLKKIYNVLVIEDQIRNLEKVIPELVDRQEKLEKAENNLKWLLNGLTLIRGCIDEVRRRFSETILEKIQDKINNLYTKICNHPYYDSLKIISQLRRGKTTYYFTAYNSKEGTKTHVKTRFSQAQINETALSVFLALATTATTTSKLGLLILDDPTQSMDNQRKRNLAETLNQLAKLFAEKGILIHIATADTEFQQHLKEHLDPNITKTLKLKWTPQQIKIEQITL